MTDVVGLRFVAENEREATQALQRFTDAQSKLTRSILDGASRVQSVSSAWQRANQLYREGVINANALKTAQTQVARELAVLNGYLTANGRINTNKALAELRAAQASREAAEAAREQARLTEQASQSYERLRQSIDPAYAAQQRYAQAERTTNQAVQQGIITEQQAMQTMALYRQRLQEAGQSTVVTTDATGRLRAQFLATANSIAILDGPLGGIASRFSAFGVLIGRTGLILGGLMVTMAALGTLVGRGTRQMAEWEVQTARINAILETTRHAVGLTTAEIESMTSRIALNTLESEQSMRAAAIRLLTFRDVAGDVFEEVLQSATDMAALGFGTVESESLKLAKALDDPAQALTSLSRAGIVFTRQQRQIIISLVESGRRAEAMDRVMQNVRARTQGAAEAAASGTLAGAFDTIGQAVSRATREFGSWVLTITGARAAIEAVAESVSDFAAGPLPLAEQLRGLEAARRALLQELEESLLPDPDMPGMGLVRLSGGDAEAQRAGLAALDERIARLREEIALEEQAAAASRARAQVERDIEGLDNLQMELDLRREAIGLTEDQARVQRMLAQEGLRGVDIEQRVAALREGLEQAGAPMRRIVDETDAYRRKLEQVAQVTAELVRLAQEEREARTAISAASDLETRVQQMATVNDYLRAGVELSEAQRLAEEEVTSAIIRRVLENANLDAATRATLEAYLANTVELREQERIQERLVDLAQQRSDVEGFIENLEQEVELMEEQLRQLESGVAYTDARRAAEIQLERVRIRQLVTEKAITEERAKQLNLALSELVARGETAATGIAGFRPPRGGGGGREREVPTLQALQEELLREQAIRNELLHLGERERLEREVYYDLVRRLGDEARNYTEEQIMGTARLIAEQQRLNDEVERQRELQERVATTMGNLFMAATQGAQSFRRALSGVLTQLASMLANRAFMELLSGSGIGGMTGPGSLLGLLFGGVKMRAANGAAFQGGNVIPFARGGVVGSPTTFPMSGGRTGLMGEAGPEAIMPLKRGRDGKLGVSGEPQKVVVDVRAYVDQDGNFRAAVEGISGDVAERTTRGALIQYDRNVAPDSRKRHPRKRG